MGRPEKPVDHTVPALGALAEHLRAMRRDACLTYRQLAERTHYSSAQLKRAANGRPSEKAVAAALQFLWQADERRILLELYAEGAGTPERSREELGLVAEIIQQLSDYEAAAGSPSVRSDKRVDTATLPLPTGTGKTMALLALLDGAARGFPAA